MQRSVPNGASVAGMGASVVGTGASVNGFVAGNGASVISSSTRKKTLFEDRLSKKKLHVWWEKVRGRYSKPEWEIVLRS